MSEQPKGSHLDEDAVTALPLAHLRRKAGRPRNAEFGRLPDTSRTKSYVDGASPSEPTVPRLLNLKAAAAYLGVSPWTIRDLEAAGTLKRVSIPVGRKDLRKLLFDRIDLDELIERWKTA